MKRGRDAKVAHPGRMLENREDARKCPASREAGYRAWERKSRMPERRMLRTA